ncbi:hypothetical protein SCD_n00983 [Sulfuricella denitrificans skB26]|uniref:diguanylate cyclase n=1 Tax=Sulfuricella denitrificans (strain DSM 22764 / NBRC 105220 / skB26) TaxID=1163617 RepID=S6B2D3_SULDS|nr:diguanylate cyclase [Sulfuricella denitrificans]BAN34822.1 hypothetical protein SCD_n00983 [Sulfuricella denitrificans skB26]
MKITTDQQSSTPQDAMQILRDLDTGIMNHMTWMKTLHRALICDEIPEPLDLSEEAHCHCKFGHWYYQGNNFPALRENSVFLKIGALHKMMHDDARTLLQAKSAGHEIGLAEYDKFMDGAISFKWEVRCLQFEIVNSICTTDYLTGAWNRQSMMSKLTAEMERMTRSGQPCCICMMDIDHFKEVNDNHGHSVGDQVLQTSVQFIADRLRKYDSIFRYGGEEFLICLPETQLDEAELILNRIRTELSEHAILLQGGNSTVSIAASFGVAIMTTEMSIQDAINMADHALLCAKATGRNRVCVWRIDD